MIYVHKEVWIMTDKNYAYFVEHLDELIEMHNGKHVVIKDESIIGVYDSFKEAYDDTIKTEELGTFIIQQCVTEEEEMITFVSSNVAFV